MNAAESNHRVEATAPIASDERVTGRELLFLVEPAPYVIDFLRILGREHPNVEVVFLSQRSSQAWPTDALPDLDITFLPSANLAAFRRIWRLLSDQPVKLVHIAGWSGARARFVWIAAWWRELPIFVESDTPLGQETRTWARLVKRVLYPVLFRMPFRFLPAGSRQRALFLHYGVNADRIRIHQMTVDVRRISRVIDEMRKTTPRPPSRGCRVLFVGRLEPRKGLSSLIEAYRICRQKASDLELLVVGQGSMRATIEAASQTLLGLRYLGWRRGDAVLQAYAEADVFVCPSLIEPWGLVVNEAMAAGLPVIVSDKVGCAVDLVQDGTTGFVVPSNAPEILADRMLKLASDPDLRARMGRAGRDLISGWTMEEQVRIIETAWMDARSRRPASPTQRFHGRSPLES